MEYQIHIAHYIWSMFDNPQRFKSYVNSYLAKNEPDMVPVVAKPKEKIMICRKRGETDG
jgi:hypothetical protein